MALPLIELSNVCREYASGERTISALHNINLRISAGEMIAIMGPSGSGKSTLMNIIGCLDRATSGHYRLSGAETELLSEDRLARLRREYFGFVFQKYHLLPSLSAIGNVELPAIYKGSVKEDRRERAEVLLQELGLGDRMHHRPNQLSGGEQQRVSIARSLMNGANVILADEPTGALDTENGTQVLDVLRRLHADGFTIIIITHNPEVARFASRIVNICDGSIVNDEEQKTFLLKRDFYPTQIETSRLAALDRISAAIGMALQSMLMHRLRTFLTMLGIIIGIASVVLVVGLGEGSRRYVLDQISSLGTNTLEIRPGSAIGNIQNSEVLTLNAADAENLQSEAFVDSVTPVVNSTNTLRYENTESNVQVNGVGVQYFRVHGLGIWRGSRFDEKSVRDLAQVAIIDTIGEEKLFRIWENPIGKIVLIGFVPFKIVGVLSGKSGGKEGGGDRLNVWAPYSAVMGRLRGQYSLESMTVRIKDNISSEAARNAIERLLIFRHGRKDFYVTDYGYIRDAIANTASALEMFISCIAAISLIVGGVGVMNIMLVSVTERTQEIGLRIAVGARQSDILIQFLIEAILVCLIGGLLGMLTSFVGVESIARFLPFQVELSERSILAAFLCAACIGLIFGYIPARRAARLAPVDALARE